MGWLLWVLVACGGGNRTCEVGETTYRRGEGWVQGCNLCECSESGPVCTDLECPDTGDSAD